MFNMSSRFTPIALIAPLSLGLVTTPAFADDDTIVDLTLAGGVDYSPDYEGSDDYELDLIPYAELSAYDGLLSVSVEGAQAAVPLADGFAAGLGLGYDGGRDEDDNDALDGLGDVDGSLIGSVFASAEVGEIDLGLIFSHALGGGIEGYTIDLDAGHATEVIEDWLDLELGAGVTWGSQDYLETFFGIDAAQAAASGLDEIDVDAGFKSVGVSAVGNLYLTDWLTLGLQLDYQRLLGDTADSPIIKDEGSPDQFSALVYLAVEIGLF